MKKTKTRILSAVFCMICLFAAVLSACGGETVSSSSSPQAVRNSYSIYYVNEEGDSLLSEDYLPEESDMEYLCDIFIGKITDESDSDPEKYPLLEKGVSVENQDLSDGTLTLDMSSGFLNMSRARQLLAEAGMAKMFTQIEGIRYIALTVDGSPLLDSGGREVGKIGSDSFVENVGRSIHSYQNADMTLYFTDETGSKLLKEDTSVYYSSNEPLERAVVEQLMKGPSEDGHYPVLSSEVKILSVVIQEDTCYVNFDSSFKDSILSVSPEVQLYAIVNSIIDTCGVRRVQFTINGKNDVTFRDQLSLKKAYRKNEELIEQNTEEDQDVSSSSSTQ